MRLKFIHKVIISFCIAGLFLTCSQSSTFKNLFIKIDERSIDFCFLHRKARVPDSKKDIMIVYINEEIAKEYGYLTPIPRKLIAELIEGFASKGAAAIGVDIWLNDDYPGDEVLETVLKKYGEQVVLFSRLEEEKKEFTQKRVLERFSKHATLGFASSKNNSDEIHRWVNIGSSGSIRPFSIEIIKKFQGKDPKYLKHVSPHHADAWSLINFTGPPSKIEKDDEFNTFDIALADEAVYFPKSIIKDKIILIGAAIKGRDEFLTPYSNWGTIDEKTFGIELQAMVIDMLLNDNIIKPLNHKHFSLLIFLIVFVTSLLCLYLKGIKGFIYIIITLSLYCFSVMHIFKAQQVLFPVGIPVFSLILSYIFTQLILQFYDSKNVVFLKRTFERYVSPDLVNQLVELEIKPKLGGEKKELSILFTDLANFTKVSEKLEPEKLISLLNEHFTEMTHILLENNGTLDKYIGDSIMAFYGAPLPQEQHAYKACLTAIKMKKTFEAFSKRHGIEELDIRIGINTDDVIVGNTGSDTRFDYTVMGDGVNLASRLEALNKYFKTTIMLSERTYKTAQSQTNETLFVRELGLIKVKGKDEAIRVYELLGNSEMPPTEAILQECKEYHEALTYYQQANFSEALTAFTNLEQMSNTYLYKFYREHTLHLQNNPPEESWAGEIIMKDK